MNYERQQTKSISNAGLISESRQEEVISALWIIAALTAFSNEYSTWGWIFAIKGASDVLCSIYFAINEALSDKSRRMMSKSDKRGA